jgi:hypothetical protein
MASEPLLPYVVALLVAGVTLLVVGVVLIATSGRRGAPPRRRTREPWTCAACGTPNAPDRGDCYACHARRPDPGEAGGAGDGEPGRAGEDQAGRADDAGDVSRDDAP